MTGSIMNALGIVVGSFIGLCVKKGLNKDIEQASMKVLGIVILIISLNGVLSSMVTVGADGKLSSDGSLLLLASLVGGTVCGELLKLEDRMNTIGQTLETKFGFSGVTKGFIDCSLLFCIGAMSIMGAINDGLYGDSSILLLKSALDGVSSIFFVPALGIGVLFSAVSVLFVEGGISLAAKSLAPLLSPEFLNSFSMVGYALLMCIGLNFVVDTKIKTTNVIPALLVPIFYEMLV